MARFAMTVDQKLCVTCNACVIACKSENAVPPGAARCWTVQAERGTFPLLAVETRSERCNHCENAPCVSACPTRASHYEPGGLVEVDPGKCVGCKACIIACPYEVRYLHPDGYVDKCTLCVHRLDRGLPTACEEVCPTQAIAVGDADAPSVEIARRLARPSAYVVTPEAGTRPNVFYVR